MENIKRRQSSVEMLRIFSMFLIVCMHLLWHGNVLDACTYGSFNYYLFWTIRSLCYISVNSFVLISGYFMVNSKLSVSKLLKMILQTLFYSLILYVLAACINNELITIPNILIAFFPISSGEYWFITTYFLLCILSPILNAAINTIDKRMHRTIIMFLLTTFCIIPSFLFWTRNTLSMGRDLNWFITLYFIGAYIKKYGIHYKKKKLIVCSTTAILFMVLSLVIIGAFTHAIFGTEKEQDLMFCFNSIFSCIASVSVFLLFLDIKINTLKISLIINSISRLMLGVYLFHENPFIRSILWDFVNPTRYMYSVHGTLLTLLYMLFACFTIMVIGCVLERVRLLLFDLFLSNRLCDRIAFKIDKCIDKINVRLE